MKFSVKVVIEPMKKYLNFGGDMDHRSVRHAVAEAFTVPVLLVLNQSRKLVLSIFEGGQYNFHTEVN